MNNNFKTEYRIIMSAKNVSFLKMFKENYTQLFKKSGMIRLSLSTSISICVSIFISQIIYNVDYIEFSRNILLTFMGGMLGLIAFAVSAIAIVTAMISNKMLIDLVENSETNGLVQIRGIFFPFYFSAWLDFISLIMIVVGYFMTFVSSNYFEIVSIMFAGLLTFIIIYTIFYSIELIGYCIQVRFLSVKHEI